MSSEITTCPYHPAYKPVGDPPYFCVYCCIVWRNEKNRLEEIARKAHYKECLKRMKDYKKRVERGGRLNQEEYEELMAWARKGIESWTR